jgi:hypothetical protein
MFFRSKLLNFFSYFWSTPNCGCGFTNLELMQKTSFRWSSNLIAGLKYKMNISKKIIYLNLKLEMTQLHD